MKHHLFTIFYAGVLAVGLFFVLETAHKVEQKFCNLKFNESTATVPCTELNERVYTVRWNYE